MNRPIKDGEKLWLVTSLHADECLRHNFVGEEVCLQVIIIKSLSQHTCDPMWWSYSVDSQYMCPRRVLAYQLTTDAPKGARRLPTLEWEMRYSLPDRSWSQIFEVQIPLRHGGEGEKPFWKRVQRDLRGRYPEMGGVNLVAAAGHFKR